MVGAWASGRGGVSWGRCGGDSALTAGAVRVLRAAADVMLLGEALMLH